jgi:RNA polymerase sigma factor (sigma-70 family)
LIPDSVLIIQDRLIGPFVLARRLVGMANLITIPRKSKRQVMVAVVLGTALSTMSPVPVHAAPIADSTLRAIADINRYCTTCWRNARLPAQAWNDCTQEVFTRLLERLPDEHWTSVLQTDGAERRELIRAIDSVKKRHLRMHRWTGSLDGVADRHESISRDRAEQRNLVDEKAQELLTPRQQRILQLSFEGWSVQEIATEMATAAERVSDEKYKAIRKLRAHLGEVEECRAFVPSALPA